MTITVIDLIHSRMRNWFFLFILYALKCCVDPVFADSTLANNSRPMDFSFKVEELQLPATSSGTAQFTNCAVIPQQWIKISTDDDLIWQSNLLYTQKVQSILLAWKKNFASNSQDSLSVSAEAFAPILSLADNLHSNIDIMDANLQGNTNIINDLRSFTEDKCDFSEPFYFKAEKFAGENPSFTNSLIQYLKQTADDLEDIYYTWSDKAKSPFSIADQNQMLQKLAALSASDSGSAGLGEILYLYEDTEVTYFSARKSEIGKSLSENPKPANISVDK